jgi:uncharacterized protein YdeI (YjbR/CyaY-like superfamily)
MNPEVSLYLKGAGKWRAEMKKLRDIFLGFALKEELKWGKPCYSFQGSNVVILAPFKPHIALLFCKGTLLKDAGRLLINPGENSQATLQMRFTGVPEIEEKEPILKAYIQEAIEVEKAGLEVKYKTIKEHKVPEELQKKLNESPRLKKAFAALTPGRQRGYFIYFSAPKQSTTRAARVEKCVPRIMAGKGLNDR